MKLRHLDIFYNVMITGSLTRAADRLNISQPAASKALKHAEQQLGLILFQRIKGKLIPTQEALILFDEAQEIYQNLDKIRDLARNLAKNPTGKLRIGCLPSLGLSVIPEVTGLFLQKHKSIQVSIGTYHTNDLIRLLSKKELDIAIGFDMQNVAGISSMPIDNIPLVYIDSLPQSKIKSLDEIDIKRWIHPGSDSLSACLLQHRKFSATHISVQTYHMAAEFVKAGLGCSITDIFSAQSVLSENFIFPTQERLYLPLVVSHRMDSPLSRLAQNYVKSLTTVLQKRLNDVNLKLYGINKNSIA